MKRRWGRNIWSGILLCTLLSGCLGTEAKQDFFNATVLEIAEDYLLVEPVEGESGLNSSDKIQVTKDVVSTDGIPDLTVGDEIRIVYNGEIMETYPAKLGIVYAIYRADALK